MVYVASLSLMAKKALGPKCHQSSINGIIDTMSIDPAVSNMDVVLLGPSDLTGPPARRFRKPSLNGTKVSVSSTCVPTTVRRSSSRTLLT